MDRIEELIADLDAKVDRRYRMAFEGLVRIGAPAVGPLCRALTDASDCRRGRAAEALGEIGDSRAVEPLSRALMDEDFVVRGAAAMALGMIGDVQAIEPLSRALTRGFESSRRAMAEALGSIGRREALPYLRPLSHPLFGELDPSIRAAALAAIASIEGNAADVAGLPRTAEAHVPAAARRPRTATESSGGIDELTSG
jgi:HEAT repeat protein